MNATEYVEAPEDTTAPIPESPFAEFARTYDVARLCGRMDFERRQTIEGWALDLYRLVEVTPDNETADPRLVHALQNVYAAISHIQEARRALLPIAADRGQNNHEIL